MRGQFQWSWTTSAPPPSGGGGVGGGGGFWVLGNSIYYVYDGKRVIQERDSSDNPAVGYTWGNDLSGSLEGAGGIGGMLARSSGYSSGSFTSHAYYHADGNGNITYLEDSSQDLAATYEYDPFGNALGSGPLATANTHQFSSKEYVANAGLYYYLYRFYSPSWQRWVNRDPVGERSGINLYVFVENDPEDEDDADGLDPFTNTSCTITAYCSKGPGADWQHYKPKKKGGKVRSIGNNTLAYANTSPPAWPFGSQVTIYGPNGNVIYHGTIHDTGSGWDKNHHSVDPKKWFDVWLPTKKQCDRFGVTDFFDIVLLAELTS
jgi:RHS repeat-associated protein